MGLFDRFKNKQQEPDSAPSDSGDSEEGGATRHCFVLSATESPGDLSQASRVASDVFGPGFSASVGDENIVTVTHGDTTVGFLAHMPIPIPGGEAEDNADGNFLWPDGREEAAKHQSHVIVTNIGAADQTPVQSVVCVARLAMVALKLFDGLGVYWGNANVANSREIFEDFCEDISEEHVPIPVLLRFQFVRTSDTTVGLYTLGMGQFELMDIEVDDSPLDAEELFEFASNIAHYLIQSGPVIADGNTVGGSAEEKILVRHLPSMLDDDRHVYKIVFE